MKEIKVRRYETVTIAVETWVEVPDDYSEMDIADFDDYVTNCAAVSEVDENVVDVIDTTAWEVVK